VDFALCALFVRFRSEKLGNQATYKVDPPDGTPPVPRLWKIANKARREISYHGQTSQNDKCRCAPVIQTMYGHLDWFVIQLSLDVLSSTTRSPFPLHYTTIYRLTGGVFDSQFGKGDRQANSGLVPYLCHFLVYRLVASVTFQKRVPRRSPLLLIRCLAFMETRAVDYGSSRFCSTSATA
jgi:hypothetical protein